MMERPAILRPETTAAQNGIELPSGGWRRRSIFLRAANDNPAPFKTRLGRALRLAVLLAVLALIVWQLFQAVS